MNVKFRKLGWLERECLWLETNQLEWRWLGVFIAPTTILAVAVDGALDSPVVHRTGHYPLSGACNISRQLRFGAVGH
jgi:hypothetical protein